MTRMWPPGGGTRRPLPPRAAAPREPVDQAKVGRGSVRRRARGMTHTEAAAALEDAHFGARQDSRHEDLANDERGPAELAEWARITQLLAGSDEVYDPQGDVVVQAELAADAAAAAAREAELREAMRVAARADELQALRELGTLEQTEPREGDEAVRDELTRRAGSYVQADVDTWFAHVLAAHRGHYRDPAAREEAARLLPAPVLTHAALLAELARLVPGADVGELAFAAQIAITEPEAAGALAAFLTRVEGTPPGGLCPLPLNLDRLPLKVDGRRFVPLNLGLPEDTRALRPGVSAAIDAVTCGRAVNSCRCRSSLCTLAGPRDGPLGDYKPRSASYSSS